MVAEGRVAACAWVWGHGEAATDEIERYGSWTGEVGG